MCKDFPAAMLALSTLVVLATSCGEQASPQSPGNQSQAEDGSLTDSGSELPQTITPPAEGQRELLPGEQQAMMQKIMQQQAQAQAAGLGGGGVEINGAWAYSGYSYLAPNPEAAIKARLVAVDVTISGHRPSFDLDDIEIIDGASQMSFGSDPHITLLDLDSGEPAPVGTALPVPPLASRWLLIYAFPEATPTFQLVYWGQVLNSEPHDFASGGLELPFPKEAGQQ
ncbi:MAG: hypothetical protein AAF236_07870 [Verrucomicrobiota bacterium]